MSKTNSKNTFHCLTHGNEFSVIRQGTKIYCYCCTKQWFECDCRVILVSRKQREVIEGMQVKRRGLFLT